MAKKQLSRTPSLFSPINFVTGSLLILASIFFILTANTFLTQLTSQKLSFTTAPKVAIRTIEKQPSRMVIKSIGVDLAIIPGQIQGDVWPMTDQGVTYINGTAIPGESGNSILYGHNWPSLLRNLGNIRKGDQIIITYDNNSIATFEVITKQIVNANDTEILGNTSIPQLTLYTCTGFLDLKRLVVIATPLNAIQLSQLSL